MINSLKKPALIGIVTVLYNSEDVLRDYFISLSIQTNINFILYLIDNSETNIGLLKSIDFANLYNINIKFIFNNKNVGVAKGNNQGINLALEDGCQAILLSNNDLYFNNSNILYEMYSALVKNKVSAVVPKILYFDLPNIIWCAGGKFNMLSATTPHIGDGKFDSGEFEVNQYVSYSPTCFMLFDASIFKQIGFMNENYFVYYDDVDFIWRFNKAGKKMLLLNCLKIWHKVSYSTGGSKSLFGIFYGHRNRIIFIRYNFNFYQKLVTYLYLVLTLPFKFFIYDLDQRKSLINGYIEGIQFRIDRQ